MNRYFEKISLFQFKKDISIDLEVYNAYVLPTRGTNNSAGYDFRAVTDVSIKPSESIMIPTGIKVKMGIDEVLLIIIRSSMALNHDLCLLNQTGVIDSDYYNNTSNEGHIYVPIKNNGKETYTIKAGDRFAQGIFTKFLIVDNETNDIKPRIGGFGSTNKGDEQNG